MILTLIYHLLAVSQAQIRSLRSHCFHLIHTQLSPIKLSNRIHITDVPITPRKPKILGIIPIISIYPKWYAYIQLLIQADIPVLQQTYRQFPTPITPTSNVFDMVESLDHNTLLRNRIYQDLFMKSLTLEAKYDSLQ